MNLMEALQRQRNLTYLFISHDLRAIRHTSDRVAVMYLGKLVELADAKVIYDEPLMPYTKALISAVPIPDPKIEATRRRIVLEGDVPSPINPPSGCRFHTRCPFVVPACREVVPQLVEIKPGHFAACIRISPEQPHIEDVAAGATPGLASGIPAPGTGFTRVRREQRPVSHTSRTTINGETAEIAEKYGCQAKMDARGRPGPMRTMWLVVALLYGAGLRNAGVSGASSEGPQVRPA